MDKKKTIIHLVLIVVWIAFIFNRSLQPASVSAAESGRVLTFLMRFMPFGVTEHLVRKLAHFSEFAVLGVLAGSLALGQSRRLWTGFLAATMLGLAVALCDEGIQLFVDGRSGRLSDVMIDAAGAAAGAGLTLAVRTILRWLKGRSMTVDK